MTCIHALYRFYGATGQLLYVGITNNPGYRFQQHQQEKPWWHEVSGITVERYESREDALAAETRAIGVESPRYNVQRPTLRKIGRPPAKPKPSDAPPPEIVWICESCRRPVADQSGYIHISHDLVTERTRQRYGWERTAEGDGGWLVDMEEVLKRPEEIKWHVHHAKCDPEPDGNDYWIGVERARTFPRLLKWTAHLMGKGWILDTDWDRFINRIAGQSAKGL